MKLAPHFIAVMIREHFNMNVSISEDWEMRYVSNLDDANKNIDKMKEIMVNMMITNDGLNFIKKEDIVIENKIVGRLAFLKVKINL